MSIKSFLVKLWIGIKSMFAQLPDQLKNAVHIGVVITETFKKIIDSPLADLATMIIPGDLDDKIKNLLRAELPAILIKVKLVDISWSSSTAEVIIRKAAIAFADLDPEIKPAVLHNISILIAQLCADGKLTWSDAVYLVQWYYKTQFKPTA